MRFLTRLSFAVFLLLPLGAVASSVSSMSTETVVPGPDGSNYVESVVKCRGTNDPRTIWRKESGSEWCPKAVEGYCSRQKIRVAQWVCGRQYDARLDQAVPVEPVAEVLPQEEEQSKVAVEPATDMAAAEPTRIAGDDSGETAADAEPVAAAGRNGLSLEEEQRQLEIERERLRIEQERLELRRQQVELQKQELEIQRQLESKRQAPAAEPSGSGAAGRGEGAAGSTPHRSVLGM